MIKLYFFMTLCIFGLGGCDQSSPKSQQENPVRIKSSTVSGKKNKTANLVTPHNSLRIVILDFNKVWQEAKAPEKIRNDIQNKRRDYQREVIKFEEQLRKDEESLQSQHEKISAEEYQDKKKKFELAVLDLQKKVQHRKQGLEKSYSTSMNKVGVMLNKIVEKIAKEQKLDLVLSATHVAFSIEGLNITEQVINELDAALALEEFNKD